MDRDYVYTGLCGLARAHRAGTMAGHLGAALLAGCFFIEEHPHLDAKVQKAITGELDRIIGGEETVWFDPEKAHLTVDGMFAPFAEEAPQPEDASTIIEALDGNIDTLRQSGHNVIFATLAFRALQAHPEHATPRVIDRIRQLIEAFDNVGPGRGYYGKERGWHMGRDMPQAATQDLTPSYDSEADMVDAVIQEVIASASVHRRGYGGLFHVINHAAALVELRRLGFPALARRGLAAHQHHVGLLRSLPDVEDEFGALKAADHDPTTPAYWLPRPTSMQWSGHLTHRVKTLFGFCLLAATVKAPAEVAQANAQFRYLMA